MKAFILAAGFGTRLRPFTNHHPKALAEVNGKSLLERNIRYLQRYGIYEVVVNVHHFADQIIQTLIKKDGFGSSVLISDEREEVLETGGGLKKAAPLLCDEGPFLMINVDILSDFDLKGMLAQHLESKAIATLAVQKRESSRRLLIDEHMQLCGWENVKTSQQKPLGLKSVGNLQRFAFSGIQILAQSFPNKINQEGKFSIIDSYLDLCATEKIMAWDHTGDLWLDVGKEESLEKAETIFKD